MTTPHIQHRAEKLAQQATIAIVTALPQERVAMEAMLEDPIPLSTGGNASGEYWVGTIPSKDGGRHVVILARCDVAENLAAANTTILLERLPQIELLLVVGIAGAAPDPTTPECDVRLGDIVVVNDAGVVQYDYDKELRRKGNVKRTQRNPPRPPAARLLAAAKDLEEADLKALRPWEDHFVRGQDLVWTARPTTPDELHDIEQTTTVIQRAGDPRRRNGFPRVFRGCIASGNKLLKNAKLRDRLQNTFRAIAVEMEASGVADASWLQRVGYFVIRGTCDYCDEYKNDDWQGYAALAAAAYARALLEATRASATDAGRRPETDAEPLSALPSSARKTLTDEARRLDQGADLLASFDQLVHDEATYDSAFDAAWPCARSWTAAVVQALAEEVGGLQDANLGELMLAWSLPFFSSLIMKTERARQFRRERSDEETRRLIDELWSITPTLGNILSLNLSDAGKATVRTWAHQRLLHAQRREWKDDVLHACDGNCGFAQLLASLPYVPSLIRALAGNMGQLAALPVRGGIRLGSHDFDIRWRQLACILTVAEARVIGGHLLSPELVQHIAQLPDTWPAIKDQFDNIWSVREQNTIVLRAICDEPVMDNAIETIAQDLSQDMKRRREAMAKCWIGTPHCDLPDVKSDVQARLVDGRPRYTRPHVRFKLSSDHARRLLMGSNLWGDPSLAYRELFQNALDACRYRAARSKHLGLLYEPRIAIYHGTTTDGEEYVECEDNGIGMDRALIASCFSTAGQRFVDTDDFRREQDEWRRDGIEVHTNSQFGIGVFSYFLAAQEVEIETARLHASGAGVGERLLVRVPTASSFFRIVTLAEAEARAAQSSRDLERSRPTRPLDAGTRVRLRLLRRADTQTDETTVQTCVDVLREHVWFSEIALEVSDFRGDRLELPANQLAPWLSYAEPVGDLEPRFWWLRMDERHSLVQFGPSPAIALVEAFRSRKREGKNGPDYYAYSGRVLVDGIATDVATPGFVINLAGSHAPKLSLDRRRIVSDIRSTIEESVSRALGKLPHSVSETFLGDLWLYDPRACERANEALREGACVRTSESPLRGLLRRPRQSPPAKHKSYFPWKSPDRAFGDEHNKVLKLWELARRMPDARDQSEFVLSDRGVAFEFRKHLKEVPDVIWDAWLSVELGIPEAAALEYASPQDMPAGLPLYMSWLSGAAPSLCRQRLEGLIDLFDLRWPRPIGPSPTCREVTDYDAWLLGNGTKRAAWIGPILVTLDVVLFARHSGRSIEEALESYRALADKLGWAFHWDPELAAKIGYLSRDEASFASAIRTGSKWYVETVDPGRAGLIANAGECTSPPAHFRSLAWDTPPIADGTTLSEGEEVVRRELGKALRPRSEIDLAVLCQVARNLGRPCAELVDVVRKVAQAIEMPVAFDAAAVAAVDGLEHADWLLIEEPRNSVFRHKRIRPPGKRQLAAIVSGSRCYFQDPLAADTRLRRLFGLFGWGAPPSGAETIAEALKLTSTQSTLAKHGPSEGHFSIPQLVVLAATEGLPLAEMAAAMEGLSAFEIVGPAATDTYMGIPWSKLASRVGDDRC